MPDPTGRVSHLPHFHRGIAWKGQATKARNRAAAGTCPFCGQHLRDLERHVVRQHADLPAPDAEPTA